MKNKPNDFDRIETNHMTIQRVKIVNYTGFVIDENLYWNAHVDIVCTSLVKYFGIFNHIKPFITSRTARELYCVFINSRIDYGIEVYGHCAYEHLSKLQTLQNKLLKLLLKLDRRTSTNKLHRDLSLLKVSDIHAVSLLCFVNKCRATRYPEMFLIIIKFGKQNVNFVTTTTLRYHWLEPKTVSVHVTWKELDYGKKIWGRQFTSL